MLEGLKISNAYDGFVFLAQSALNPPMLSMHHHVELELNLVVAGEITYLIKDQRVQFKQGELVWFPSLQEHQLVDRTDDAEYYVAVFTPSMLRASCREENYKALVTNNFDGDTVVRSVLAPTEIKELRRVMDDLIEEGLDTELLNKEAGFGLYSNFRYEHSDPDWLNAGLRFLLLQAWRYQVKRRYQPASDSLHPAVQKALQLLNSQGDTRSLQALATQCGVSSSYLSRTFHKQLGIPLTRYRNSTRLKNFWDIYNGKTEVTMLEAAFSAGFGSYSQFYRAFFEVYACNPRELIDKHTKE